MPSFLLLFRRRRHLHLVPPFFSTLSATPPPFTSRSFLTLPPTIQHLTATRTLPYPPKPLYDIITDIPSYPLFLPYLTSARVLTYSAPDAKYGKRWPRTAELGVNWGGVLGMSFRSRVFCVPERIVEAVAGPRGKRMAEVGKGERGQLAHYEGFTKEEQEEQEQGDYDTSGVFSSLMARWTLRQIPYNSPFPSTSRREERLAQKGEPVRTEVDLEIEVKFTNPAYATLSQAAAPKMADIMIEAFEERTRNLLVGEE